MEVRVVAPDRLDEEGAAIVASWLGERPSGTLMPALGTSALGIYRSIARLRARGSLDTSRLTLVQLDEYAGLARDDPRNLFDWLLRDVAGPLEIPAERVIRLRGDAPDAAAACRAYVEDVAAAGGIDVAVLGLGPNGHLGFNEPPSAADAPTRKVELSEASLGSNARYWGGRSRVPSHALTAGMDLLLAARRILLVVTGPSKAAILRRVVMEPVSPDVPASLLRTVPSATLLADTAAWPRDVPLPASVAP
jgi:glucosamine-6-phosphate deaminase